MTGNKRTDTSAGGERFRGFAAAAAGWMGTSPAFAAAIALVAGWAIAGPFVDFDDTWLLALHTTTTIVTFLMVFLIQATQNRDAKAIQLKLNELVRASGARDVFAGLEGATEEELLVFQREFEELRERWLRRSGKPALN
jgi:low affinity Fe/Cu permease